MVCRDCSKDFIPNPRWHHKWGICSDCRIVNIRRIKAKYKKTEKGKLTTKRWHHSKKFIKNEKKYRAKPKAKHLAVLRTTRYYKRYPEKKKQRDKLYGFRSRGYNAGYIDWEAVENLDKVCKECGTIEDLTIDHIRPLSKGGTNDISNLQVLCRRCNATKGNIYEIQV